MRILWALSLAVIAGGCSFAVDGGITAPASDLPGCDQTDHFAFTGETTMAALGLGDFGGPDGTRVGKVWVTADAVEADFGGPAPGGEPLFPPVTAEPSRMFCVQWADGSGMSGPVPDDWQLPPGLLASDPEPSLPVTLLVLGAMLMVLVGASALAFRRDS
jgi:hypothetical protein